MPVVARENLLFVPAQISGQQVMLLVDTGAERTILTEDAVKRLHLALDPHRISHTVGIGGPSADFDAIPGRFTLGGVKVPVDRLAVGRFTLRKIAGIQPDGLLGADILSQFDIDIDPADHHITLYRGRFCGPAKPLWASNDYEGLPDVGRSQDRLTVPIVLDGITARATLDTGAQFSAIGRDLATRAGVSQASLAADRQIVAHGAAPGTVSVPAHRFQRLQAGNFAVNNPVLPVVTLPRGAGGALLGGDFLAGRRVWLSFPTEHIFIER